MPGRFGYDVKGDALVGNASTFSVSSFDGRVYGDARGDNKPGSNVDPNILSEVMPWFLSFCRICNRAPHNLVAPDRVRLLSEEVGLGDLVIFGGDGIAKDVVFVDTVLCVGATLEIPQLKGRLNVREYFDRHAATLGLLGSWDKFTTTRAYRCNLKDSEEGRNHHGTKVNPHHQIVGKRSVMGHPTTIAKEAVVELLLSGNGFNFIPLRPDSPFTENKEVISRPGLFSTKITGIYRQIKEDDGDVKIKVAKIDPDLARWLIRAIVYQSEKLVLDPVTPTSLESEDVSRNC